LALIELERVLVVVLEIGVLFLLAEETIADDENIDLRAHEAGKASSGLCTMGSPRTLKLVLTTTGQPVAALNRDNSAW
jgi:hypothetical protein